MDNKIIKYAGFIFACASLSMASSVTYAVPILNVATGNYYEVVSSGANGSWANAEANAVANGGHLVTINNAAEETWLRSIFGAGRFWIGFTDQAVENTWEWISGEAVTYTNWGSGEPNDSPSDNDEDYAVVNWNGNTADWNDWDHTRPDYSTFGPFDGIAEYSSVPEPGSLALLGLGLAGLGFSRRKTKV